MDSFNTLQSFKNGKLYSLPALGKKMNVTIERLPVSIRIVLESVLRNCDGKKVTEQHVRELANWQPNAKRTEEISKHGYRTLSEILQAVRGLPVDSDRNFSLLGARGFGKPGDYNSRILLLINDSNGAVACNKQGAQVKLGAIPVASYNQCEMFQIKNLAVFFVQSIAYAKDGADPQWDNDPGMKKFYAFLEKNFPEGNKIDGSVVYGYGVAQTLVKVLEMCGDDLTRANVMKQAASLKDFAPDTMLPGVTINTSASDFAPISQLQLMRFKGEKWDLFGDVMSGDVTN